MLLVIAVALVPAVPPAAAEESPSGQRVYFVGIPNLLWTDLDAQNTPAMWDLLGHSAAASLAVRSYPAKTCPDDAWASIGAGNRARSNYGSGAVCPLGSLIGPPLTGTDGAWYLAGENELTISNAELSYKTSPGLLADLVGCVAAIGPGGSVAAAHGDGLVDGAGLADNVQAVARDLVQLCPDTGAEHPVVIDQHQADGAAGAGCGGGLGAHAVTPTPSKR